MTTEPGTQPGTGLAESATGDPARSAPTGRARLYRGVACAVLAVLLLAVPQFASPFTNLQLTLILVYGVAILGLDVLVGRAGQVSLGQSAFLGLGAYAAAYAFDRGWGPVVALALAIALGLPNVPQLFRYREYRRAPEPGALVRWRPSAAWALLTALALAIALFGMWQRLEFLYFQF